MLRNFLKTAVRNIFRKRSNAWINILGLALGLSIALLIWMHVLYERSYDRFFEDHRQIYRVQNSLSLFSDKPMTIPSTMFGFSERVADQVPEVEMATRLTTVLPNAALKQDERIIHTPMIAAADSNFFDLFPMEFLAGDPATALAEPNSLVLTYSLAKNLFEEPLLNINQTLQIYNITYRITAIIEDLPGNTHMAFNGLISMTNVPDGMKDSGFGFFTYLKLRPRVSMERLEEQLSIISEEVVLANPYFHGESMPVETRLVNLADIHLKSNLIWEMKDNGSLRNVRIFSAMSLFILLLALINYINMATARSSLRAKEIGLRKVAGTSRGGLIKQFMFESFLTTLLAFILALILAENLSGFFSGRLGVDIQPGVVFTSPGLITLVAMFTFTGLIAGVYPAFYLSSFNPVNILKGEMVKGNKGKGFRRALVVFQFAITIFLVSSLMVIAFQLNFMMKESLGFEKDSVLVARDVSMPVRRAFPEVVSRLEALEGVRRVTGGSFIFGETNQIELISEYGGDSSKGTTADILTVDETFIPMMEIPLSEGRNFHPQSELDARGAYILNQAAVVALGLEDPLQSRLNIHSSLGPIIGVVENFQLKSLHSPIEPLVFRYARSNFPQIYIKTEGSNPAQAREKISEVFHDIDPTWYPNLIFLDERLEALYSREKQSANLLWSGSVLAIIISLLGVYGLAAFAIERRVKEIGIRKVLGASGKGLLWLFNKEFSFLVLIAFLVAAPLAWWAMDGWLNHFAMRIRINPLWFLIPAGLTFLLNAAIISIQVFLATKANPIEAIRIEN